ncbi:hypothetical protein BRADI_2g43359v3 [Brachypodium distachyon]|uniref:Uncharacterized protein n=1 Tax=Brachypodium distachyon TaxID=15368 RepID=A0A2K2DDM8_BRADI|nr:hypothetical protein BRADI_2g43359v3 [Brachypodium distachyon]
MPLPAQRRPPSPPCAGARLASLPSRPAARRLPLAPRPLNAPPCRRAPCPLLPREPTRSVGHALPAACPVRCRVPQKEEDVEEVVAAEPAPARGLQATGGVGGVIEASLGSIRPAYGVGEARGRAAWSRR